MLHKLLSQHILHKNDPLGLKVIEPAAKQKIFCVDVGLQRVCDAIRKDLNEAIINFAKPCWKVFMIMLSR